MKKNTLPKLSSKAFIVIFRGDSMEPEFVDGDSITIDPEHDNKDGDFVLAECDGKEFLRQLVIEGTKRILKPLNSCYPAKEIIGSKCKIVGRVMYRGRDVRNPLRSAPNNN